jgi:hypothetical protein
VRIAASAAAAAASPQEDQDSSVKNLMLCDELNPDMCPDRK